MRRLIEVGRFTTPSLENYQPGQVCTYSSVRDSSVYPGVACFDLSYRQFFLHRVFGYRGVVLFPWMAQVYDREAPSGNAAYVHGTGLMMIEFD